SESTRVPPVTEERSPPLSRITGADSPVIADSSTEATPSITSPSPGIRSPAATSTRSPLRSCGAAISSTGASGPSGPVCLPVTRLASVSLRARRSVSACALPRPSAIASAKLAKRTVNQSQSVTPATKPRSFARLESSSVWMNSMVVMTLPISTTNITGFFIWMRGSSFLKESLMARRRMAPSKSDAPRRERRAREHQQVLDDRTERERREEGQRADDQNHADDQPGEERRCCRECAQPSGRHPFAGERAGQREHWDQEGEATYQHGERAKPVVEREGCRTYSSRAQPGERRAIVAG